MMNIRECFLQVRENEGYDAMSDRKDELYAMWENDFDALKLFAKLKTLTLKLNQ